MIITMRIRLQGFIVFDYVSKYAEARKEMSQWLAEGKLQRKETIVKGGLAVAEQSLVDLYQGVNTGEFHSMLYEWDLILIYIREIIGRG